MASPSPSLTDSSLFGSPQSGADKEKISTQSKNLATECSICHESYSAPKVLACLHTFCQSCLEKLQDSLEKIQCPKCEQDCALPPQGVSGLLSDYAITNVLENSVSFHENSHRSCTSCKTNHVYAVAQCHQCDNYLCEGCVKAHKTMQFFEGHDVVNLKEQEKEHSKTEKLLLCPLHKADTLRFFCRTCDMLICNECAKDNHPKDLHDYDHISDVSVMQIGILKTLLEQSKAKSGDLNSAAKSITHYSSCLDMQYKKAKAEINDTYSFYVSMVEERKEAKNKELNEIFKTKMAALNATSCKIQNMIEEIQKLSVFVNRMMEHSSYPEILMFKQLLVSKLIPTLTFNPATILQPIDLEFHSNYPAIQVGVRNTFGYLRHNSRVTPSATPLPIARPSSTIYSDSPYQNGHAFEPNTSQRFGSPNSFSPFPTAFSDIGSYEKWSSSPEDTFLNSPVDSLQLVTEPAADLGPKLIDLSINTYPLKSLIQRQKMAYNCKFGEFGVLDGQFTEPSGVAVNAQNDIIVADTNNHRIQIFDREGRYKFRFGDCGKQDGQLLYPNRVAVVKTSGDIIVTERSPTHQIQIYNQYGQFVRKFGAKILQHPRGVTVDNRGLIIVVECKVMRVLIFDQFGNILQNFGCSKHLEFPNGVVVNDRQEIFISDNRAHCVKVFNYEGAFLRKIGGQGLTNYPIGVCINQNGEILIADNHNNFNLTVFTQDGRIVSASESRVKHAQCFDVALMDNGSIVLASKDYRLYIYNYVQAPILAM